MDGYCKIEQYDEKTVRYRQDFAGKEHFIDRQHTKDMRNVE